MRQLPGTRRHQRGVTLISAIFVITIMAALAAGIARLLVANSEDFAEQIQLLHALHAAESGASFGMNQLFPPLDYPSYGGTPSCPALPLAPMQTVYEFTTPELANCTATVQCSLHASITDTGTNYYSLTSTGTCGAVQRAIRVHSSFEP